MFDSPGLVDFAIMLVNTVLYFDQQASELFGEFKLKKNCNQSS